MEQPCPDYYEFLCKLFVLYKGHVYCDHPNRQHVHHGFDPTACDFQLLEDVIFRQSTKLSTPREHILNDKPDQVMPILGTKNMSIK